MSKVVFITGANRGIGLALAMQYIEAGYEVIASCRIASEELKATGAKVIQHIDVTNPKDIEKLGAELTGIKIDVLINNAGLLESETLGSINYRDVQRQFEVNTLGPLRVTEALLDNLSTGSKIGLITSRMGSIADNGSGGYYGYRMSKAALNAAGESLAKDLQPKGIAVAILHPGFVQTEMVNYAGDISADTAAERLKARLDELSIDTSGSFWHSNGELLPW